MWSVSCPTTVLYEYKKKKEGKIGRRRHWLAGCRQAGTAGWYLVVNVTGDGHWQTSCYRRHGIEGWGPRWHRFLVLQYGYTCDTALPIRVYFLSIFSTYNFQQAQALLYGDTRSCRPPAHSHLTEYSVPYLDIPRYRLAFPNKSRCRGNTSGSIVLYEYVRTGAVSHAQGCTKMLETLYQFRP